jgi:uracil-DNA glycosylase family 4
MDSVRQELARWMAGGGAGRIPLFRGDEERAFLLRFIAGPEASDLAPGNPLHDMIQRCTLCGGILEKKTPYGSGENGLMVILSPPAMLGAGDRRKYRKEAAALVRKMLEAIGADPDKCHITSLIKCESDDLLSKPSFMFTNCAKILQKEIAAVNPRMVIMMGDLVPLKRIVEAHKAISWFSVDHPVSLLKNPELKKKAWNTLKLARDRLRTSDPS